MGNLRLQNFQKSPGILASLLGVILVLNARLDLYAQGLEKHYLKAAKSQKVFFVPSYKSAGSQQPSSFKPSLLGQKFFVRFLIDTKISFRD